VRFRRPEAASRNRPLMSEMRPTCGFAGRKTNAIPPVDRRKHLPRSGVHIPRTHHAGIVANLDGFIGGEQLNLATSCRVASATEG
jgi:hypothetical protein